MARTFATGLAVAVLVVGATVTACGKDDEKSSSSSASSSATSSSAAASATSSATASPSGTQPSDYTTLLIKPEDVGPDAVIDGAPIPNPSGVTGAGATFKNPEGTRFVIDTVAVFDTVAQANDTIPNMKDVIAKKISGSPQPVDVGTNGFMVAGTSTDGTKALTEIVFVQGRAVVDLEYASAPNDPVPPDVAMDIARKQDTAVKNGLPG
jgi:hypothetical protein